MIETEALLKMDIFFVVTTAVVLLLGTFAGFLLYYLVHIVRDIREITRVVKKEAVEIAEDFREVRTDVKEGVHEVREQVTEGIDSAKKYTKAVAGAGIVKAVSNFLESLAEEREGAEKRSRRRTKK